MSYIQRSQRGLRSGFLPWYCAGVRGDFPHLPEDFMPPTCLQTLDILFTGRDFPEFLRGLCSGKSSNLKGLCLDQHVPERPWTVPEPDGLAIAPLLQGLVQNGNYTPLRLESLRLTKFNTKRRYDPLQSLLDLSMLAELRLYNVEGDLDIIIRETYRS
jgi:hypothetical protein